MKYADFITSMSEKKIHYLDEVLNTKLDIEIDEPLYCISSSGTESKKKRYLTRLSSLVKAAKIVNNHYSLDSNDRWLQTLTTKHVGGFMINVRSVVAGMKEPSPFKWEPLGLIKKITDEEITLLSLVPAQVFDLVSLSLPAPKSVKCVFVGGGSLGFDIYKKACDLGWPLKLCYGMTETSAQMAYSEDGGIHYRPYKGWEVEEASDKSLKISGPGLFSYFREKEEWAKFDKTSSWYQTGDAVELNLDKNTFKILGRGDGLLKEKGAFKNYQKLKEDFEEVILSHGLKRSQFELLALRDQRGESLGVIVSEAKDLFASDKFKALSRDIKGIYFVDEIPRTDLLKVNLGELTRKLQKQIVFS